MRSVFSLACGALLLALVVNSISASAKTPRRETNSGPVTVEKAKMTAAELFQSAKLVPYLTGKKKKLSGFVLANVVPTTAFSQLGMRDGDVLKGANGINAAEPTSGVDIVQSLEKSDSGEIKFLRGGKEMTVKYVKR